MHRHLGTDDVFHRRLFTAAAIAWAVFLVVQWLVDPPLNHDEAALALCARAFLNGEPRPWMYRPIGMSWIGAPGILAGGSELALRALPLLIAITYVFAVRQVGRVLGGAATAWAAAVLAGTYFLAYRGPLLLSDTPSTICVLVATAILATELDRADGPRWRMAFAGAWLALAFYVRYASLAPIVVLGVASIVVWPRALLRRPGPALATLAAFALLMVPHFLDSLNQTDHLLGILRWSSGTPRKQQYVGEGLVTYVTANPFTFYGGLAPVLAVAGLASIRIRPKRARRPALFFWLVAVGQVVMLGLQTHAQARYVAVAVTLLCLLGADVLVRAVAHASTTWRRRLRRAALAAVALSWAVMLAFSGPVVATRGIMPFTVDVARIVRADAAGRSCIVYTRHATQLMWYGGCYGVQSWALVPAPHDYFQAAYHVWEAAVEGQPDLAFLPTASPPLVARTVLELPWLLRISSLHRAPSP